MREGRDNNFLEIDGKIIGINLGADYCSEHEWGIKELKRQLGIPGIEKFLGIKGRTTTLFPENQFFFDKGKTHTCLTFEKNYIRPHIGWKNYELDNKPKKLATAWDEGTFGIVVENTHQKVLEEIYEAFKRKDISLWLGGGHVFQNAGLCIAITSLIPEELTNKMLQADFDYQELQEAAKATGIHKILKGAKKEYFALSPRWKNDEKTEITFWLNPCEQQENNFGWYSVDDLKLWAEGKGPIPKKRK
jgi:hypothetical protein